MAAQAALGGYTPAGRWSIRLADGRRAFVKTGADAASSLVATWLRLEHRAYESIAAPFMPRLLGWDDDGASPLLLLEDLSGAVWPPPWTGERIALIEATLDAMAAMAAPEWAPSIETRERGHLSGWERVRDDPEPFLRLGLCSGEWLGASIDALVGRERLGRPRG